MTNIIRADNSEDNTGDNTRDNTAGDNFKTEVYLFRSFVKNN